VLELRTGRRRHGETIVSLRALRDHLREVSSRPLVERAPASSHFPRQALPRLGLTDPVGKGIDDVRPIRDDIDQRVRELLTELVPARTM
jgi:hypothetical protein